MQRDNVEANTDSEGDSYLKVSQTKPRATFAPLSKSNVLFLKKSLDRGLPLNGRCLCPGQNWKGEIIMVVNETRCALEASVSTPALKGMLLLKSRFVGGNLTRVNVYLFLEFYRHLLAGYGESCASWRLSFSPPAVDVGGSACWQFDLIQWKMKWAKASKRWLGFCEAPSKTTCVHTADRTGNAPKRRSLSTKTSRHVRTWFDRRKQRSRNQAQFLSVKLFLTSQRLSPL